MSNPLKDIMADEQQFNEIARSAFDNADTDKSGQIDAQEFAVVMNQISIDMGQEPPTKDGIALALSKFDTDKSGKLDFNEFKVLVKEVLTTMASLIE